MCSSRARLFLSRTVVSVVLLSWVFFFPSWVQAAPSTAYQLVNATLGKNNWYITGLDTVFTATASAGGISSINYYYDRPPATSVTFSGINSSQSTEEIYTINGTHTLYYWSVDSFGAVEATKTAGFKIDTMAPNPWLNWTAARGGNDHSYSFTVGISDSTSGIDPSSAQFQYREDSGSPFGVYPNVNSCSGNFNAGSWASGSFSGVALSTPTIDFCDSNWGSCNKSVRVSIADLAGNTGSSVYCLNSPWVKTVNGNAHAESGFSINPPPTGNASASYIVSYGSGGDSGFSSAANWYLPNYSLAGILPSYTSLYSVIGAKAVSLGALPTQSGVYLANGDFTVDNSTTPKNLSGYNNLGAVIFINGNLTVNNDFVLSASSAYVFVVSGKVRISDSVNNVSGFFIAGSDIEISYDGGQGNAKTLNVSGGLATATGFSFARELAGPSNQTTPAVVITLPPAYFLNSDLLNDFSSTATYSWQEIAP